MFFDNNTTLLEKLNLDKNHRVLLQESMFYYCCGKDPSPIIEFKEQYPLYIYVDKRNYSEELYDRLTKQNFKLSIKKNYLLMIFFSHLLQSGLITAISFILFTFKMTLVKYLKIYTNLYYQNVFVTIAMR